MNAPSLWIALAFLTPGVELKLKSYDWPQWRGPNRDGVSTETGLLKKWPENGPKKLWTATNLGGGYSTPSVAGGLIFGMGRMGGNPPAGKKDRGGSGKEAVWAVKESDGTVVWTTPFADAAGVGYGEGPRSTPTYYKGNLYSVGVSGDLVCMEAQTGKLLWKKNFQKDFKGKMMSGWGYCESVLIDEGRLICTPGADEAAVVALKPETGELIWKASVPRCGGAGYASPVRADVGDVPMYITLLGRSGGVVAVHAKTGKLLWQYTKIVNGTANIPTAVVKNDLVFVSTGYADGGSALLRLKADGGAISVEELKYYSAKELQNHHGGMVLVGKHLFLGRGHNNGLPTCVEFETAKILWKEDAGAGRGTGSGCVVYADGMLYFRYQNGVMALVPASAEGFDLAGRFEIPDKSRSPSWPHPVVANGKLFIRDQDKMHCYDIKAK